MDAYVGTKIILAEPAPKNPIAGDLEPGYRVFYEDGYESWSPKATFERAYRPVSDGEFDLLEHLQADKDDACIFTNREHCPIHRTRPGASP